MEMLNAPVQNQADSLNGRGDLKNPIKPRTLKGKKVDETLVPTNNIKEIPSLYARVITPSEMETARVIYQLQESEDPNVPISTQLNNKINPVMNNMSISGGDRILI